MASERIPHMSSAEFRRRGKEMVDWIADYYERIGDFSVLSQVKPGEVRGKLPEHPPARGESFDAIRRDLDAIILPGITHWQSPNFYAFFPTGISGPSFLGEMVSSGLGIQGMLWATSPACTELEIHVLDWLVEMLALPAHFRSSSSGGGVIQDSASSATLCAILAARERATAGRSNLEGVNSDGLSKLVAYASSQTHSSIEKDLKIAGIGSRNLRAIEVDANFAMKPEALARQIEEDIRAGLKPFVVCATTGTTSAMAFDPLPEIGAICQKHHLWLHVDAAMAGTAALCPEFRWVHDGLELADSYCFNPHKWMLTNFDCTAFYVRERKALTDALSIVPEYLRNTASEAGSVIDYRDWQVPLGRRFRALKLWFVIRHYGVDGLQEYVRQHVAVTQEFAAWVRTDQRFEVLAPVKLNLVCFRLKGDDARNEQLLARLNLSGKVYLTHTKLDGKYCIRICIGQTSTAAEHVRAAWELIQSMAG
jgi:aromatic-L-amino-acid/L-tryptophan decarboxylase